VVEAANSGALSQDEIAANQLQIDSAVASITPHLQHRHVRWIEAAHGSLDYITSGVTASQITALHVHQANFGTTATMPVQIDVLTSANHADLSSRPVASPRRSRWKSVAMKASMFSRYSGTGLGHRLCHPTAYRFHRCGRSI